MDGTWGAITCGSEQTGGIRNVYAYRISIVGATKYGLYVKSNTRRGGFTENVHVDRMTGVVERSLVFVTSTFDRQMLRGGQPGQRRAARGRGRLHRQRRRGRAGHRGRHRHPAGSRAAGRNG